MSSRNGKRAAVILCAVLALVLFAAQPAFAQPAIPGAAGYGTETPGGRGGTIYRVTSLEDTNTPGTLRYAINQQGPRIVIFDVSGTINVNNYLDIQNPYITIAGQTAPSPGIFLRGAVIRIMTHDVVLQHLRVAPGDDPLGVAPTNRDAIVIGSSTETVDNIVIDHCTFTWSVDEIFSAWGPYGDVTFKNVIASEPLNDSIHVDEGATEPAPHGFGPVFDNIPGSRVTVVGSLFSHAEGRQPYAMASEYVQVNNVFYDRINTFNRFTSQRGVPTLNSIVGNLYINGPSLADWAAGKKPIAIDAGFAEGGKVYLADNAAINHSMPVNSQWDLVDNNSSMTQAELQALEPPVWNDGLTALPSGEVLDYVLDNAGARPADRLPYEMRIIDNVRNGTGEVVDSIAEIGGWPVVAENVRHLVIPKNPGADDDGDGYTNVEEWLEAYAAYVEGRGPEPPLIDPEDGEPEPEPEPEPVPETIADLWVNSEASGADSWMVKANLQAGDLSYGDRAFRFASIPDSVAGSDWIMAAANSKSFTGETLATFKLTADADVYLAFDDRMAVKPAWLSDWTDTGEDLTIESPAPLTFSLYKKSFAAGSTVTLGRNGNTTNLLYIPIAKKVERADVDRDGDVDVQDLLFVVSHLFKNSNSPDWDAAQAADVNLDGVVNGLDVAHVAKKMNKH
jgi:hypothetical protein